MEENSTLPLAGIKVLDLGVVLMAPYAAQWLADFGADVVKVETSKGDDTRRTGPAAEEGMSSIFLSLNRNKRSIILDLKTEAGRAALGRLIDGADILLHNNRPQKAKALGLDPEALLKRNPRLVCACLHGFQEAGPYGGQPAYDDVIQGLCGLVDLMRVHVGMARYVPTAVADKAAGLIGAIAILAALSKRDRTGIGGYVEIPMFESMVAFTATEHFYGMHFDPPKGAAVYPRISLPERRPFATTDGYICVVPYTDKHWHDLFEDCDRPDLAADPRYLGIGNRTQNIASLYTEVQAIVSSKSTAEWIAIFDRLQIPCAPAKTLGELVDDPHLVETKFFAEIERPGETTLRFPGIPVLFDGERPPIRMPPRLGQHTHEVLREAGLSDEEIQALG